MATGSKSPSRDGNVSPPSRQNSLASSDQEYDTFVDIDIKHEPGLPGIEIFDEENEQRQFYNDAPTTSNGNNNNHHSSAQPPKSTDNTSAPKQKKRLSAKKQESVVDDVLRLALNELKKTSVAERLEEEYKDDVCMAFGQMVASELRLMKPKQRIVAKKLINEAIFYGSLGSLQPSSRVMANLNSVEFDKE